MKVALSCVEICGYGVNASIDVNANLEPEEYDVDLGNRYGAPFGTATTGETFEVNVRIVASSAQPLKAYQIVIMFDDSLVQVNNDDYCVQGDGWSSSWECTANDPIDEVLMVGSCASNCEAYGNLDIGTIAFQVLSSGVNTFTAYITKIKDDVTTTEQLYIFACKDILVISDVGRRLMPHGLRLVERRLTDCDGDVPGDTNADCVFDVEDVEYLQFYIVGIVSESDLSAAQLLAMDTDLNSDIDGVDIGYLMKVVALKYHFVTEFSSVAFPVLKWSTTVRDGSGPATAAQTELSYEIGTKNNLEMSFLTGTNVSITDDGVFVGVEMTNDGLFETASVPYAEEYDVGIVLIIVTYDAKGQTSDDRRVSYYCTRLLGSCTSVFGDTSAAFRPGWYVDIPFTPAPTVAPSSGPTYSNAPTMLPTSPKQTAAPSDSPTGTPQPTSVPSSKPSPAPSAVTFKPSVTPSSAPSATRRPTPAPTTQPSLSPTPLPTGVPSSAPTLLTIWKNCSFSASGEMDPTPFLRLAHPEMKVYSGTAFGLTETSVDQDSYISRKFGPFLQRFRPRVLHLRHICLESSLVASAALQRRCPRPFRPPRSS